MKYWKNIQIKKIFKYIYNIWKNAKNIKINWNNKENKKVNLLSYNTEFNI